MSDKKDSHEGDPKDPVWVPDYGASRSDVPEETKTQKMSPASGGSAGYGSDIAKDSKTPLFSEEGFLPPVEPGEVGQLGTYRLIKQIGQGGMGAVYLAVDQQLGRKIAIKVMLPKYAAQRTSKERFLREARAASQVTHDNIVTIFKADERDGIPFIAMQLLEGSSLEELLKQSHKLTVSQILRIGHETALGLAAAHRAGLVHRDIKPGNLWIEAPSGRVKILDFGLARPVDNPNEITNSGAVIGTPAYMSPEQASGQRIDSRTDLFSLGALLYKLCTGKLPFRGSNTMAVLTALATEEPSPILELNRNIPPSLAQLIHQLLAKNPVHRPQTAENVAERMLEIAEHLHNSPTPTDSPNIAQPKSNSSTNPTDKIEQFDETKDFIPKQSKHRPQRTNRGQRTFSTILLICSTCIALTVGAITITRINTDTKSDAKKGSSLETQSLVTTDNSTPKIPIPDKPEKPPEPASAEQAPAQVTLINNDDSEREVAEWVLEIGGQVIINDVLYQKGPLPKFKIMIERIDFPRNKVQNSDLVRLSKLKRLHTLDFSISPKITVEGIRHLSTITSLRRLSMPNIRPGGDLITPLLPLKLLSSIEFPPGFSDADLNNLTNLENIDTLIARFNSLTVNGIESLSRLRNLEHLYLDINPRINDDCAKIISNLAKLKTVSLPSTSVGATGWKSLSKLPSLESATSTQPYSASILEALSGSKTLKRIEYYHKGEHLEKLKNHPQLSSLFIDNTSIGDEIVPTIVSLKKLKYLQIKNTAVTSKGYQTILASLPDCRIESAHGTHSP